MGKMFGTDGVRGVANRELSPMLAFQLGRAGARVLTNGDADRRIVIGKDTRVSGDMLEDALSAGICSAGVDVVKLGVLPTPGIAYLTRDLKVAGGVVISASHNPVEDNGIKFFGASGYKLPDATEAAMEALVEQECAGVPCPTGGDVGRSCQLDDAVDRYVEYAKNSFNVSLDGLKIVLDCANGAAFQVAPRVFGELGATVTSIFNQPDGVNINAGCGSTHPETLMKAVVEQGADLGLAFDGDADRLLAVDAKGRLVDGDQIMVICARYLQKKNLLKENTVVVTVMSNLGLHLALRDAGIRVVETTVGDRYVLEELLRIGACFGGEQSGHIISLNHNTTGDGIFTALQLLTVVAESGRPLAELASQMERFPQLLENVRVADKASVLDSTVFAAAVRESERELEGSGRILIRPSGTEPLVRVMAEGRDMKQLENIVGKLVDLIAKLS